MPCMRRSNIRAFVVPVSNAFASTVPSPSRELIVEDFPTPDFPSRRIVHVNPKSLSTPSRASCDSASATARSKLELCPRPPSCFFPALSCSASSRR